MDPAPRAIEGNGGKARERGWACENPICKLARIRAGCVSPLALSGWGGSDKGVGTARCTEPVYLLGTYLGGERTVPVLE